MSDTKDVRDPKTGQFLPGHRPMKPPGAAIRKTTEIRNKLSEFLSGKLEELPELWDKLSHKERARLFARLLEFAVPKIQGIAITSMNEPTKEAIARVFDFSDPQETQLWIEQTRQQAFPQNAVNGNRHS